MVESLRRAGGTKRSEILEIFKSNGVAPEGKISTVLGVYKELGIKEAAEEAMDNLHKKALEYVKDCGFTKEQKERLHEFAAEIINREK